MCETCGCGDPEVVPVEVQESLLASNDHQAQHNREHFRRHRVTAINLMGSPGCGKTALLEITAKAFGRGHRLAAVSGDRATDRDATRLLAAGIDSRSITPDVQFGFRNGMALALGLNMLDQDNLSNGNETRLDQNDVTGSFNYAFRLPRSVSRTRKQVRSTLSYLQTAAKTCLEQGTTTECVLISDVRRREIRGGLDTDLLQTLSGGLQVDYTISDARHLSRRTSQISIIASFQLSLFAGDYR